MANNKLSEKKNRRQEAYLRGLWAERLAEISLWLKGYRTLARRYRNPKGEIDLIMRRGSVLVFVEVKYRPSLEAGLEALSPRQRTRIQEAAQLYVATNAPLSLCDQRLDLVVVRPRAWPKHFLNLS